MRLIGPSTRLVADGSSVAKLGSDLAPLPTAHSIEAVLRKILLLLFVIPVPALGQPYFSIGFGLNAASELESVRSGPDFGGSLCDET